MKNKFILSILSVLMLSGCMNSITKEYIHKEDKTPVKLPYNFFIESFVDLRDVKEKQTLIDTLSKREQYTFQEDMLVNLLVKKVNGRNLYDYDDATLRVELKDYAAFRQNWDYTVSFYLDVTGFDEKGKVLATGVFSCIAQSNEATALLGSLGSIFTHDQNAPKNIEKDKEVWHNLYKECINDIAYQFNNKIVEWGRGQRS
tara:strand:- start:24561 stop:25163 length:603 start_codon:yes stop_codon:yes gene_type:complete